MALSSESKSRRTVPPKSHYRTVHKVIRNLTKVIRITRVPRKRAEMLPKSWKSVSILKLLKETTMDLSSPAHCGMGSTFNVNINNKVDYKTLPSVTTIFWNAYKAPLSTNSWINHCSNYAKTIEKCKNWSNNLKKIVKCNVHYSSSILLCKWYQNHMQRH